jgi:selenide,water dikinase
VLAGLRVKRDPALLVGFEGRDDAAVYRLDGERALVSTVDFFSPMVDDPLVFGRIAAANALSDVYAMGGRPLYALNLVCFPQRMDRGVLEAILAGGAETALEAGVVIAGGHSIYDHEPKYGLAVTGLVDPRCLIRNNSCREGDALILTKALGVGLIQAGLRAGEAGTDTVRGALDSMERLNRYAAEKFAGFEVHACTDVTGFGLAVHAAEMAGDRFSLVMDGDSLPLLGGALGLAEEFYATAGGQRNRNFMAGKVETGALGAAMEELVFDPQTSGGLLIAAAAADAEALLKAIARDDPAAAIIGEVCRRQEVPVVFV